MACASGKTRCHRNVVWNITAGIAMVQHDVAFVVT
jgi:hypothetical protein